MAVAHHQQQLAGRCGTVGHRLQAQAGALDGGHREGAVGVRDLSGNGNNIDNPAFGAADEPFIRLTDARYGAGVELDGQGNIINRALNPIFDKIRETTDYN